VGDPLRCDVLKKRNGHQRLKNVRTGLKTQKRHSMRGKGEVKREEKESKAQAEGMRVNRADDETAKWTTNKILEWGEPDGKARMQSERKGENQKHHQSREKNAGKNVGSIGARRRTIQASRGSSVGDKKAGCTRERNHRRRVKKKI